MADLLTEISGHVGRITLNRPDLHNAFNGAIVSGIRAAVDTLGADPDCRVIILSGRGKSFSAGGDLNWMKEAKNFTEQQNRDDAMALSGMLDALNTCPKPVIAVAQGAAMGGGVGLLACADCVVAAEGTRFALSEVKLGLTPATISPYVVRAIGARWARRLFVTAELFDTARALDIGLVHELAPDLEAAHTRAEELASQIAKNGPEAVQHAKKLVLDVADTPITDRLRADTADRIAARRVSEEGQEGLAAFLEKRKPNWLPGEDA